MPDQRLARRLHRSTEMWQMRRAGMGIPLFNPQKHHWTPAANKLLSGAQTAHRLVPGHQQAGRQASPKPVRHLAGRREEIRASTALQPKEDALLGTIPDVQLARRLSRTVADVRTEDIVCAYGLMATMDS